MSTAQRFDPDAFQQFEHEGWQRAAEHYAGAFGALTIQTADALLNAVGAGPGVRLLDVATGPGFIADAAAARGATVVGLDFSPAMIAEAQHLHADLSFREGDAEALPFEDDSIDAVVMNFGLLHLARPEAALAEAQRVLRPGGRYAFTVWAPPDQAVGFGMVLRAIETFGKTDMPLPAGPPFFRFSDADECRRTLEEAGFSDIHVTLLPLKWRLASAEAVLDALSRGGVRTTALLRAQSAEALGSIRTAVRRAMETYAQDVGFVVPMPAVLASATKQ